MAGCGADKFGHGTRSGKDGRPANPRQDETEDVSHGCRRKIKALVALVDGLLRGCDLVLFRFCEVRGLAVLCWRRARPSFARVMFAIRSSFPSACSRPILSLDLRFCDVPRFQAHGDPGGLRMASQSDTASWSPAPAGGTVRKKLSKRPGEISLDPHGY